MWGALEPHKLVDKVDIVIRNATGFGLNKIGLLSSVSQRFRLQPTDVLHLLCLKVERLHIQNELAVPAAGHNHALIWREIQPGKRFRVVGSRLCLAGCGVCECEFLLSLHLSLSPLPPANTHAAYRRRRDWQLESRVAAPFPSPISPG